MRWLTVIVAWSLRNRPMVIGATVLLVAFGVHAAQTLRLDAVPDVTPVQVQVVTSSPALSPVEVEQYVTIPVERAVTSTPRSTAVWSLSKYGYSMVTVIFEDGSDIFRARQLVAERLSQAQISPHYGVPQLAPMSSALGEIFQFVVSNDTLDLMQKRELLDWFIGPQLRSVPGVVDVNSLGGEEREYQVVLDPRQLRANSVSVGEVATAVEKANANVGGGYVEQGREQIIIGSEGQAASLDDFRRVPVVVLGSGPPLTVANLGDVRFGARLRRGAASRDGRGEVVVGVVIMQLGENARAVTSAVKTKLAAIQAGLPSGTRIEPFYDRSVLVDHTTSTMAKNLVEGALLVITVLLLLLGDLRAGLVVAVTIPLALLVALSAMNGLGLSGNLMSLGAIDFGLLVDGAVIIVENAVRRLSSAEASAGRALETEERNAIIESATTEVRAASVYGEIIIAVVYLPILTLVGVEGKLFVPMATTVLFALAGAFVLSLTLIPVLVSYLVRGRVGQREPWLFRLAERGYAPLLQTAMRSRRATIGVGFVCVALGGALFFRLGANFIPQLDEGDILVEARRAPGVALSEAIAIDQRIEKSLATIPEIAHIIGKLGAPEITTDPMGIDQTDVYIALRERDSWRPGVTKTDLAREIAAHLARDVPDVAAGLSQPIQMRTNELVAGFRSDVVALVYGANLEELVTLGNQIAHGLRSVPGATDIRVEATTGLKYLQVIPDRDKLARYGVSVKDINTLVETLSVGENVGVVFEQDRRFGVVVKVADDIRDPLSAWNDLPLKTMNGKLIPLGELAQLRLSEGPAEINRAGGARRLAVEFNVRGRDMASVVAAAQATISDTIALPVGYHVEWGGEFEHYERGKRRLLVVVPIALCLILFLLWLAFRSIRTALIVFLGVPFAIVGGVVALTLRQLPFSISAGVGFIALFGVAILNGLVLLSGARHLESAGLVGDEIIEEAAKRRLRPVLMTALVAALGFVPMAVSNAPGSEVQRPLATVVIGGVISAAILTLVILPVVYGWLGSVPRHKRA